MHWYMFCDLFSRLNNEKSVIVTKNNTTNYENKIAVEKQVKYCIILRSGDVQRVQLLNYCSL